MGWDARIFLLEGVHNWGPFLGDPMVPVRCSATGGLGASLGADLVRATSLLWNVRTPYWELATILWKGGAFFINGHLRRTMSTEFQNSRKAQSN